MKIETVLISAFHKDGLVVFVRALVILGVKTIYASRGTAAYLNGAGIYDIRVIDVASIVGEPILGHRVVTLSRQVHAALLALYTDADLAELKKLGLPPIDLVCVDMYPLEPTVNDPTKTLVDVLDKMDIGGPTMLSSGSKGQRVDICDPADRQVVIDWMKAGQPNEVSFIEDLAAKADFAVSKYRMLSATYRSKGKYVGIFGILRSMCKYGENAWQKFAALFSMGTNDPLAIDRFEFVGGDTPSYNLVCDLDRLLQTITHIAAGFDKNRGRVPKIALGGKHGNPCGANYGDKTIDVIEVSMRGDLTAIFGGSVMTNFPIGIEEAEQLAVQKLDQIIAPSIAPEAIARLERKHGKCRFMTNPALASLNQNSLDTTRRFRYVRGGFLMQDNYTFVLELTDPELVKFGTATPQEEDSLILAWAIGSTSNSNTITLVQGGHLIGNGVGQQDRVGAAKLAITRARRQRHVIGGSAAYSDSFFPFPDGPQALVEAGVKIILTSKGSRKDDETIEVCQKNDVILYMIPDAKGRGFYGH
jgi:phosphoribosylaminoimidazolecarboxamide formyltransferase/IMP cyclohydrolase